MSGNNGALGNKSFEDKKNMNRGGAEQGYIYSRLWLNDYLKTIDQWNTEKYKERFELIYNRFLKIWEYPNITIEVEESDAEINIYNADKPTGKKLEYFIFEETKYEETLGALSIGRYSIFEHGQTGVIYLLPCVEFLFWKRNLAGVTKGKLCN